MTNEEAKRQLESAYPYLSNEIKLALDKATEALEKQIPIQGKRFGYLYCPNCNRKIDSTGWEWCPRCGTHISWDDCDNECVSEGCNETCHDGVTVNTHGVNAKIRANILSDDEMREIGFSNYDKRYWYFFKKLRKDISFNLTIPIDGSEIQIDILDEAFCQPYDYQHILEGHPNHEFALAVQGEVEKWMKYLADKGVLKGHEEGDYI